MADQGRWFKLWASAPADDDLQRLSPAHRWAWVVFGLYTKVHGTRGRVLVSPENSALAGEMGIPVDALFPVIYSFPHVHVEEGPNRNGVCTVTWKHWQKYQEDSTVTERVRRWRNGNVKRDKRRREEKRGDTIVSPSSPSSFEAFWQAYPKKVGKGAARKAWQRVRPTQELLAGMLMAIEKQKRGEQWGEAHGQFIPHPATWLNEERWRDEEYRGLWPKEKAP